MTLTYISEALGIVSQALVVLMAFLLAKRTNGWRIMGPFLIGYMLMLVVRIVEGYDIGTARAPDLVADLILRPLISFCFALGLWLILAKHVRVEEVTDGGSTVTGVLRNPFDRAFYDSACGYAIVSAGNAAGDRIWNWTGAALEGRFLRVNQAFADLVGYTQAELCELRFHEITEPTTLAEDLRLFHDLKAGRIARYTVRKSYRRRDGSLVPVILAGSAIRATSKSPISYYIAQVMDMSAEVEARTDLERGLSAVEYERDSLAAMLKVRTANGSEVDPGLGDAVKRLDTVIASLKTA